MLRDTCVNYSQNYRQDELNLISNLKTLTCIQDIAMSPAHSSVVSMIPNQNTARTGNIIFHSVNFKICVSIMTSDFCSSLQWLPEHVCSHGLLLEAVFAGRWLDIWGIPLWLSAPRHPPHWALHCLMMLLHCWSSSWLWCRRREARSLLMKPGVWHWEAAKMWLCSFVCTFGDAMLCRQKPLLQ